MNVKKYLAYVLTFSMLLSVVPDGVLASTVYTESEAVEYEIIESGAAESEVQESEAMESEAMESEVQESVEKESVEKESVEKDTSEEEDALQFLMILYPEIAAGETQQIVLAGGNGEALADSCMILQNESGREAAADLTVTGEGWTLYEISMSAGDLGCWNICRIEDSEGHTMVDMQEKGLVGTFWVEDSMCSAGILADGSLTGDLEQEDVVAGLIVGETEDLEASQVTASANRHVVITIDPGHDEKHGGTFGTYNGVTFREEILNLDIARYVVEELKTYAYTDVFMTRETMACPHPGTSVEDNVARVTEAASRNSDYYVAIHLNESDSTSAKGAEVYYPNTSYATSDKNPAVTPGRDLNIEGRDMADSILTQLGNLGVSKRGIYVRSSTDGSKYPDGSKCDYYKIPKTAKELGMPALIVEECFLSNAADRGAYLTTEEGKKKLGVATAKGIASYLNLRKKTAADVTSLSVPTPKASYNGSAVTVSWNAIADAESYIVYRKEGNAWVRQCVTSSLSWKDSNVAPGDVWTYTVKAQAGKVYSAYVKEGATAVCLTKPVLGAVKLNASGPTFSWNTVTGAEHYFVYRKTASTNWAKIADTTSTFYCEKKGESGTRYIYTVRAVVGTNNRSGYDAQGISMDYYKNPVIRTTSGNRDSGIAIAWEADPAVSLYRVYRKEAGGSFKGLKDVSGTSFTDTSVAAGVTYAYTVRALSKEKKLISGYDTKGFTVTRLLPPVIQNLKAEPAGLTLTWAASAGADSYYVYRKTADTAWTRVWVGGECKYIEKDGISGTNYTYTVRAHAPNSLSRYDEKGRTGLYLDIPQITAAIYDNQGALVLNWKAVPGAEKYRIFRKKAGGSWSRYADTTGTQWIGSSELDPQGWYYTVRCVNAAGKVYTSGYDTQGTLARGE